MKNNSLFRRILSVVLVLTLIGSVLVPAASAAPDKSAGNQVEELTLTPIDPGELESHKLGEDVKADSDDAEKHAPDDVVRVSIVLEKAPTLDAGFKSAGIANNSKAKAYREGLRADQKALTAKIESTIGSKLDVKWNLTLAANIISANMRYGDIEAVKALDGVKSVFVETQIELDPVEDGDEPNNGTAYTMIGSNIPWANGYTGAGSKIAVIDTGIDKEHQSFSGEGLEYALEQNAAIKGMSYDEYAASLNLLTAEKIEAVKDQLNADIPSGEAVHVSTKIAFAYNYVDGTFEYVGHDEDTGSEHGSHVEGISAANRFVKVGDEYLPAMEAVLTQGVAPDAQIVTMKVFGKGGGAYPSDYMAGIEDAIVLGCDSANLSLGSGAVGFGFDNEYEHVMNKLVNSGMVCSISAGNSYMWYSTPNDTSMYPYLYMDDNNFATGGSPGSYTNSLAVASVDNSGKTGFAMSFGDKLVFFNETTYKNKPISTLAENGEMEYVLFEHTGVDANNVDLFAGYDDVINGKVVLCYRGASSFYQKVDAAAQHGALACIIINNQDGVINMDLSSQTSTLPAVSITMADGAAVKADSEAVPGEGEEVLYYTGTMSVGDEMMTYVAEPSDTVTVSSFSSWGVPGTLVMKPEILAPGGNIYSVNGLHQNNDGTALEGGHDQYESMSGTSMAAPQVAGMAAVMGQYIRENDLCAKTGLTQRQLTNSLLMSTAHPVFDADGNYWPVIRVGAGLGNVGDATMATSYILMDEKATLFPDSAMDGKVKAELGDDPAREGVYEYSFTVYPMNDSKSFNLRTETFIQGIAGNTAYGVLQDTATALMEEYFDSAPEVTYVIDGQEYTEGEGFVITEPTKITVRIALTDTDKMYLDYYYTGGAYIQGYTYLDPVSDAEGAFDDVVHSIPFLAYYGSWTDASMLDRSTAVDQLYGTATRPYIAAATNTNYLQIKDSNGVSRMFVGNPYLKEETFPADRLAMNSEDTIETFNYLNIRNLATLGFAVLDEEGKVVYAQATPTQKYGAYYYVNGGTWQNTSPSNFKVNKKLSATGVQEGDVVTVGFYALPEYYGIVNAKLNGEVAETGMLDNAGLKNVLENAGVGSGAGIAYTVKIDNKAPEIVSATYDMVTGEIAVKAQDDNYIAYLAVMNKSGSTVYSEAVPAQDAPNQVVDVPLDFGEQNAPKEAVIFVADYAGNETAYTVNLGSGDGVQDYGGTFLVFTDTAVAPGSGPRAWQIDKDALWYNKSTGEFDGLTVFAQAPAKVTAAEYVDGYVFMACSDNGLYVAPIDELDNVQKIGTLEDTIYDLAFNYADKQLYALGDGNRIYRVDMLKGELELVAEVTIYNPVQLTGNYLLLRAMTIDDEGNFYAVNYGGSYHTFLYKFTLEDVVVPERDVNMDGKTDDADAQAILDKVSGSLPEDASFDAAVADVDGDRLITSKDARLLLSAGLIDTLQPVNPDTYNGSTGAYLMGEGSLAWDHDEDVLYLVSYYNYANYYNYNCLYTVNTTTGKAVKANNVNGSYSAVLNAVPNGLIIVPGRHTILKPTDQAEELVVTPEEIVLMKGLTAQITADVKPWTLIDKSVTFASDDETIATVSETGLVTAVNVGETVINVTTVSAPNLSVAVPVTVKEPPEVELRGVIWDEEGKGMASVFSTRATQEWTPLAEFGQLRWGTLNGDVFYGSDDENLMWFDADTYEKLGQTSMGQFTSMLMPSDAAPFLPEMAEAYDLNAAVVGPANKGGYLWMIDFDDIQKTSGFNLSSYYGDDPMAVIAFVGMEDCEVEDESGNVEVYEDCAKYMMITESGAAWDFYFTWDGYLIRQLVGQIPLTMPGVSDVSNSVWASLVYDAESNFFFLAHYDGEDDYAHLYAIDAADLSVMGLCGDFNENVWPVTGLYQYEPATDLKLSVDPTQIKLFEGETADVNIRVKMGETNEYTVEVADPEIASFENGVVTGLSDGETDITVTTVDVNAAGEHLSETIHVIVKGPYRLDAKITLQVTDEDGARFTKLDLEEMTFSSNSAKAESDVLSGGRAGDVYIADMDATKPVILDAETFEPTDAWKGFVTNGYSSYPATDFASYPLFLQEDGNVSKVKALYPDPDGYLNSSDGGYWNTTSVMPGLAGLAFAGTNETDDGTELYVYYGMTVTGDVYQFAVDFRGQSLTMPSLVTSTGITVEDPTNLSIAVLATLGFEQEELNVKAYGLVIANNENKGLYYVDFLDGNELQFFGILDVDHISGLVGTFDDLVSVDPLPEPPKEYVSFDFEDSLDGWTLIDADGDGHNWKLDASGYGASGNALISESYISGVGSFSPDNWAISPAIDLSGIEHPMLSFYGNNRSSYYPDSISVYAGLTPNVDDMVEIMEFFAPAGATYTADLEQFAGESEVYVAFRHYDCYDNWFVAVDDVKIVEPASGNMLPGPDAETLKAHRAIELENKNSEMERLADVINADADLEKSYREAPGKKHAEGSAFHQEATVTLSELETATNGLMYVKYNPALLTLTNVESSIELHSINTEEGKVYFAYASAETIPAGTELAKLTFSYEVEALNTRVMCHTYERGDNIVVREDPVVLEFNIDEHAWEETDRMEPTCTEDGYVNYVCAECGDTKTEVLPALGHDWAEPTWDWESAEDLVYVCFVCDRCDEELYIETEPLTETTEPTCTEDGLTVVYAEVEHEGETYTDVHEEIVLPALGHAYGAPEWTWNEDFTAATAKFICGVCGDELVLEADVTTETTEPKCEVEGVITHTAEVELDGVVFTDVQTETIPALEHQWEVTREIPATCTTDGLIVRTCSVCGKIEIEDLPATGHAYGEPEWTWTETEDGYTVTAKFTCANCGDVQTLDAEVTATIVDPNCGEDGEAAYVATVEFEGETYEDSRTDVIPALGHSYAEPEWDWDSDENLVYAIFTCDVCDENLIIETEPTVETVDATCTEPGKVVKTATVELDGKTYTDTKEETVEALGHDFGEWVETAPTCTEKGSKTRTCSRCGETETEEIPALGHTPAEAVKENEVAATCTVAGSYDMVVRCSVCGEELSRETTTVEALGHDFGEWVETAPTCTEKGSKTRTCSRCGETETEEIPALGHTPAEAVKENEVEPTCTEAGSYDMVVYCSVCNAELSRETVTVEALGHVCGEPEWIWTKTDDGYTATVKFVCERCSEAQTVEATVTAATTEPTCVKNGKTVYTATAEFDNEPYVDTKEEVVPATGHSYGKPVWTWDGLDKATAKFTCSKCNDVQTVTAKITKKVTKPATETEPGEETYTATVQFEGKTYTDVKKQAIEPTGAHDCPCKQFVDMPAEGTPEHNAIDWAYTHKPRVTSGMDDTHFGTEVVVNRAQAMVFLWAAKNKPAPTTTESPFVDVKKTDWFYKAVMWAVENKITSGTDSTHFSPNKTCNRSEILGFLYAAMGKPKVSISNPYSDITTQWYKKAALWAYSKGIEKGENGKFNATTPCTRVSVVLYLYRFETGKDLAK